MKLAPNKNTIITLGSTMINGFEPWKVQRDVKGVIVHPAYKKGVIIIVLGFSLIGLL